MRSLRSSFSQGIDGVLSIPHHVARERKEHQRGASSRKLRGFRLSALSHSAPPRTMLVVSSTGLSAAARVHLDASVRSCGGEYSGDLTNLTTHLVANDLSTTSQKLDVACRVGLPVVTPRWAHESAEAGALQPLDDYLLVPPSGAHALATPTTQPATTQPEATAITLPTPPPPPPPPPPLLPPPTPHVDTSAQPAEAHLAALRRLNQGPISPTTISMLITTAASRSV